VRNEARVSPIKCTASFEDEIESLKTLALPKVIFVNPEAEGLI
jgi:hypothetical protein